MTIWLNYWTNGLRRSFVLLTGSFIKIWYQQPCQDFSCPPCLFQDSRRTWIVLIDLEIVSDGRKDRTSGTMSRLHLSSKSIPGVKDDMHLQMMSDGSEHSSVSVKVSSRSDIRNHVKAPPVLQVSSWSLGGHGHSWWTWRWCQMGANIHQKLLWKFHQDPTCFGCLREDFELWVGGGGWWLWGWA